MADGPLMPGSPGTPAIHHNLQDWRFTRPPESYARAMKPAWKAVTVGQRRRTPRVALLAALLVCCGSASIARANIYYLSNPIGERPAPTGGTDHIYVGPEFSVGFAGSKSPFPETSTDAYYCPPSEVFSGFVVAAADAASNEDHWDYTLPNRPALPGPFGPDHLRLEVTNWSFQTRHRNSTNLRLIASCTAGAPDAPLRPPTGSYQSWYDEHVGQGAWAELYERAYCWQPYCGGVSATQNVSRIALHNGTNTISTTLTRQSPTLPPAIHLTGADGCTAQRNGLQGGDRSDELSLVLECTGIKPGAEARLSVAKAHRVDIPLRHGNGSIHVELAKPPGTIDPPMYLGYGPDHEPCRSVSNQIRVRSRTFDIRINARCGPAAGDQVAHLYVGGLLG